MARLSTSLDSRSDAFRRNASEMGSAVEELRARTATLTQGGAGGEERLLHTVRGAGYVLRDA